MVNVKSNLDTTVIRVSERDPVISVVSSTSVSITKEDDDFRIFGRIAMIIDFPAMTVVYYNISNAILYFKKKYSKYRFEGEI